MAIRDRIVFNKGAFKSPNVWLKIIECILFVVIFVIMNADQHSLGRRGSLSYVAGNFAVGMAVGGTFLIAFTILMSHFFNNQPWLLNASGIEMWQNFCGFIVCVIVGIIALIEYRVGVIDIYGNRSKSGTIWSILLIVNAIVLLIDGIFAARKYYRMLGRDPRTGKPYEDDEDEEPEESPEDEETPTNQQSSNNKEKKGEKSADDSQEDGKK